MKKTKNNYISAIIFRGRKNFFKLIISSFIILLGISSYAVNNSIGFSVSIVAKNNSVLQVLSEIEKQSQTKFIFNESELNKVISVNITNKSLEEALTQICRVSGLAFRILENNVIAISAKSLQTIKVTGTVTDAANGEPLPGVNILVEGTTIGVTSDMDGKFTIEVPNATAKLVLSYVGYTTETIAVSGTEMNVQLVPDIRSLEEVVVIGYGAAKQKDLTGAIATVKSDEIKKLPVTTMSEALQGLAPGVQVTSQDGRPGSSVSVKIRGVGTFGDNTPLYVVDGYPVGGQATYIAPEDIASMTILKDASAIAIYGSRASNGVVLITTKRGDSQGLTVDFSANFTNQFAPKKIDLMNAEQFARTAVEIGDANGLVYPDSWRNPSSLKNIDWQDEVFNNALKQNYSLAIRGGNDKTKAALSLSYLDHQGIVYRSFYKRYGIGVNVDQKIGKRILLTSSIKYAFNTSQARIGSGTGSIGNIIENIPFMEGNPLTNEVKDGNGNYGYYQFREETKSSVNFLPGLNFNLT